jgi:glucose/arabinose dehydrogenase
VRRLAALVLLVATSCASGHEDGAPSATTVTRTTETTSTAAAPSPAPEVSLEDVAIRLTKVGQAAQPTALAWCDGRARPLVAEKAGRVRELGGDDVLVDLTRDISTGGEQGLLGVACRGDRIYVSFTNGSGDSRVLEVAPDGGRRQLLAVDQPAGNHNGGGIAFGPDGLLWLGLGDGGGGNDTFENAQEPGEVLGSMLRLDPADPRPEVMAKGLRNPWRWSFDRETDDLWIGDVGQGRIEEIDRLPAGFRDANLGWPAFEGTRRNRTDVEVEGAVEPIFEYGRSDGQSVVGGYVYRGRAIAALVGRYVFTDTYQSRLRILDPDTRQVRDVGTVPGGLVSSFAEDLDGELYVLSLAGGIYRLDQA